MEPVEAANSAATAWLALVDQEHYERSWDSAAHFFQHRIDKPSWVSTIQTARAPLGAIKERALKSVTLASSLPNAPTGEYVIIQYESRFDHRAPVIETVTPMREADGSWKVAGYYLR